MYIFCHDNELRDYTSHNISLRPFSSHDRRFSRCFKLLYCVSMCYLLIVFLYRHALDGHL